MEGYKYLKWSYIDGVFHLEAWLKGTAGGEWDLEGFVGTLQKKPYKNSLEQLFAALQQPIPAPQSQNAPVNQGMSQGQGTPGDQGQLAPQVIPVQTVNNTGAATMALVFGILSIVFAFLIPLLSVIFACIGFPRARMGAGSSKAGQAKTGKILCIIGLVLAIVLWIVNIVMVFA